MALQNETTFNHHLSMTATQQTNTQLKTTMAEHMTYFFLISSLLLITTNENNHKNLYIAASHHTQHTCHTGYSLEAQCLPINLI